MTQSAMVVLWRGRAVKTKQMRRGKFQKWKRTRKKQHLFISSKQTQLFSQQNHCITWHIPDLASVIHIYMLRFHFGISTHNSNILILEMGILCILFEANLNVGLYSPVIVQHFSTVQPPIQSFGGSWLPLSTRTPLPTIWTWTHYISPKASVSTQTLLSHLKRNKQVA